MRRNATLIAIVILCLVGVFIYLLDRVLRSQPRAQQRILTRAA